MASQARQINAATGKAKIRGATGKAIFGAPGAICCCSIPCTDCTDGTPDTILARVAGFSARIGTCEPTGHRYNKYDVNHDFCLPRCLLSTEPGVIANTCVWQDVFSGLVDIDVWDGSNPAHGLCPPAGPTCKMDKLLVRATRYPLSGVNHTWQVDLVPGTVAAPGTSCVHVDQLCQVSGAGDNWPSNYSKASNTHTTCLDTLALPNISGVPDPAITGGTITVIPNGCAIAPAPGFRMPNVGGQLVFNGI